MLAKTAWSITIYCRVGAEGKTPPIFCNPLQKSPGCFGCLPSTTHLGPLSMPAYIFQERRDSVRTFMYFNFLLHCSFESFRDLIIKKKEDDGDVVGSI
jgi:hypothetical protein